MAAPSTSTSTADGRLHRTLSGNFRHGQRRNVAVLPTHRQTTATTLVHRRQTLPVLRQTHIVSIHQLEQGQQSTDFESPSHNSYNYNPRLSQTSRRRTFTNAHLDKTTDPLNIPSLRRLTTGGDVTDSAHRPRPRRRLSYDGVHQVRLGDISQFNYESLLNRSLDSELGDIRRASMLLRNDLHLPGINNVKDTAAANVPSYQHEDQGHQERHVTISASLGQVNRQYRCESLPAIGLFHRNFTESRGLDQLNDVMATPLQVVTSYAASSLSDVSTLQHLYKGASSKSRDSSAVSSRGQSADSHCRGRRSMTSLRSHDEVGELTVGWEAVNGNVITMMMKSCDSNYANVINDADQLVDGLEAPSQMSAQQQSKSSKVKADETTLTYLSQSRDCWWEGQEISRSFVYSYFDLLPALCSPQKNGGRQKVNNKLSTKRLR